MVLVQEHISDDEWPYLFIEKLKISSALILDVLSLIILVLPISIALPLVLIFIFIVIAEIKVLFLSCFFAVYCNVSMTSASSTA
jgi:hypothetical protein